ncbi:hypothetical protein FQZ97_772090 [compost metagenome]
MVRLERLGVRAARNRVQHGRLDFEEVVGHHELAQRAHGLAARGEAHAGRLVGDQVDVALAVLLLLVGHAVELVGQRTQALGEQAQAADLDRQFAGLGLHERAFGTEDVAEVPALEVGVRLFTDGVARHVQLDAAGGVLHGREAGLAHHALEHHAAGHADGDGLRFKGFRLGAAMLLDQRRGAVAGLEVVRERDPLAFGLRRAQQLELFAAFDDELVVVGRGRGRRGGQLFVGHGRRVGAQQEEGGCARAVHFSPSALSGIGLKRPSVL